MHLKLLIPRKLSLCKMLPWKEKEGFLLRVRRMPKAVTEIGFKSNFLEIKKPFCLLLRTDKTWLAGIEKNHSKNVCVERKMSHFEWSCVSYTINSFGIFNKQGEFVAQTKYWNALTSVFFWQKGIEFEILKWKHYFLVWNRGIHFSKMENLKKKIFRLFPNKLSNKSMILLSIFVFGSALWQWPYFHHFWPFHQNAIAKWCIFFIQGLFPWKLAEC